MSDEYLKRGTVLAALAESLEKNEHRTVESRMIHTQEHRRLMRVVEKLPAEKLPEGAGAAGSDKARMYGDTAGTSPRPTGSSKAPTPTNMTKANEIRETVCAMSDEDLAEMLYRLYRCTVDDGEFWDVSMKWCDDGGGCADENGEMECDESRHKACILRWLKSPVKCDARPV